MQTGNTSIFVLRPCLLKAGKFEMDYQNVSNGICQKTSSIKETLVIIFLATIKEMYSVVSIKCSVLLNIQV